MKLLQHIKHIGKSLPTLLLVLGAATVSAGICMIYVPAGVIAAGILLMVGGVLMIGGDDKT